MPAWRDHIPAGAWPRLLSDDLAAAYCSRSVGYFLRTIVPALGLRRAALGAPKPSSAARRRRP